jgi:acetolactate synthase-1/2/3 large subunit
MNGAQALLESLQREGVELVFGHPGGTIMPVYDALYGHGIRHILTRHEQGAIHAATAYARAGGRVGVAMATSGPGAMNLVTGLADAMMDSTPVVAITGNVARKLIGTDAFQEADVTGVTMPVTKHNYLVTDVEDIPRVIREAFHIAATGRPGPVLVDIPKDVQLSEFVGDFEPELKLPGYRPTTDGHPRQIAKALEVLAAAQRPVLMVGGGAQGAAREIQSFAETTGIPVITTLMGLGAFPGTHPQSLHMPGMHGAVYASLALHHADLILAVGLRFDDRVTGDVARFAPRCRTIIHVDIDPAEIGKLVPVQVPIVGDSQRVMVKLLKGAKPLALEQWWEEIRAWQNRYPLVAPKKAQLESRQVVQALWEATGGEAVVTTGVGQHQMFAAQFFRVNRPRSFLTSGGLGTMGFGLPAAIGAQLARPGELVIDIDGDGSFQMTLQELATLVKYQLPVKIALINNGHLGMVRQWQELFNEKRYSEVYLADSNPNFAKLAEAYGIASFTFDRSEGLLSGVEQFLATEGPALAEFKVKAAEGVFPMIPAGQSADDVIAFDPEDQEALA